MKAVSDLSFLGDLCVQADLARRWAEEVAAGFGRTDGMAKEGAGVGVPSHEMRQVFSNDLTLSDEGEDAKLAAALTL